MSTAPCVGDPSEGHASAVQILRMRGLVHLGTAHEPTPFRSHPPLVWKREPTTEQPRHEQPKLNHTTGRR